MVQKINIESFIVFFLIEILGTVAFVVKNKFRQPFIDSVVVFGIGNNGIGTPAKQCRDIFPGNHPPFDFTACFALPSFISVIIPFNTCSIKSNVYQIFA